MKKIFTWFIGGILILIPPLLTSAQGPTAPNLGTAGCYAILSGNGAVSDNGNSYVTGDIGTNLGGVTGFTPAKVMGTIHPNPDASTIQATSDMVAAFNHLNALVPDASIPNPAALGNDMVLIPNTYLSGAATTLIGNLYLDAQGNSDAVFVIQINGALTTGTAGKVILINGAQSNNVYWRVAGAVTLSTNAVFHGTIIANNDAITLAAGDSLYGRAFTTNGAITATDATVISPEVTCLNAACKEYRSVASGLWTSTEIWEENSGGTFVSALTPPPSGATVRILHDVKQDTNFMVFDCPVILEENTVSKLTIEPQMTLNFDGGIDGNAYFNNRPVVVRSTINGTGAIGSMLGNSMTKGDGNVTLERFIPKEGGRRWNLLTIGVNNSAIHSISTIRDAWGGGERPRVGDSRNRQDLGGPFPYPLGNPGPKPFNVPWPMWITPYETFRDAPWDGVQTEDYVPYDGTIITGHRNLTAAEANPNGFDWWPELIIPKGATWYLSPGVTRVTTGNRTTPSSIRPYRPQYAPGLPTNNGDFGPERGVHWYSNEAINDGFNGGPIVNVQLSAAEQGYMLFTRGDRRVLENWNDSTTLRPVGQIRKLVHTVSIQPGTVQALTVVGNPYPAPISLEKLYNLGSNSSVMTTNVMVWDSWLDGAYGYGGYRTLSRIGEDDWVTVPGNPDSSYEYISSSQAFMVEGAAGGALAFNESVKQDVGDLDFTPFDVDENKPGILYTNYYSRNSSGELNLYDGVGILLHDKYSVEVTDMNDVRKVFNFDGGNQVSLIRGDAMLSIEAHPNPATEALFPLRIPSFADGNSYAFMFYANNLEREGRTIWIRDKFLQTETPVQLVAPTRLDFEGTDAEASISPNRFEIVIKQSNVLPVTFTDITAREQRGDVQVSWSVATEDKMSHYEVEHSRNGTEFGKAVKIDAQLVSPASYNWLHVQPGVGEHFYRVRAFNLEGRSLTTRIVKVNIGSMGDPEFKVFPTIVNHTRNVTVQMTAMEKGSYTLQVVDMAGRIISNRNIEHAGGSASLILNLPPSMAKGKYHIRLLGKSGDFIEGVVQD